MKSISVFSTKIVAGTKKIGADTTTTNNNNLRVSNIRVSNRTLIYNVCPKSALT